jgi:hypothetical protein
MTAYMLSHLPANNLRFQRLAGLPTTSAGCLSPLSTSA